VNPELASRSELMVMDGNRAVAHAVRLCRPDVIAAYPITPQTPLLEQLYRFHADGLLDAELVEVEGETSSIGVLLGASAGRRSDLHLHHGGGARLHVRRLFLRCGGQASHRHGGGDAGDEPSPYG